jgi:hypothetical protein
MTERVLPGIAVPAPRHGADGVARPGPRPAATERGAAGVRRDALITSPARAGMLLGATAAVYAVTLAGIAALQSSSDVAVAAARQPYLDVLAETRATNDALEAALVASGAETTALAEDYALAGSELAAYQARLDELAALVAEVEGSAASLPTRIALPTVSARAAIRSRSGGSGSAAPSTNSSSGASGG